MLSLIPVFYIPTHHGSLPAWVVFSAIGFVLLFVIITVWVEMRK